MALFSGAFFSNRLLAYTVPLVAMLISDYLIGFHSAIFYVYAGMALTVVIGGCVKQITVFRVGVAAITATFVFFLITNFAAWLHHDMYPKNLNGLMQAYIAGLPFMRNALLANLLFSYIAFFGVKNLFVKQTAVNHSRI